jgi:hypothetical protein
MNIAMKLFTEERKLEATAKHLESAKEIEEKKSMKSKMRNFNFLSFLYFSAYKFCAFLRCSPSWKAAKVYETYQ